MHYSCFVHRTSKREICKLRTSNAKEAYYRDALCHRIYSSSAFFFFLSNMLDKAARKNNDRIYHSCKKVKLTHLCKWYIGFLCNLRSHKLLDTSLYIGSLNLAFKKLIRCVLLSSGLVQLFNLNQRKFLKI